MAVGDMDITENWIRYFRLYISTDGTNSEALDLSDFEVVFKISQRTTGQPCTATITIVNLSKEIASQIKVPDKLKSPNAQAPYVIIEAGYQKNHALIFKGDIWYKTEGRSTETETYVQIIAAAGDRVNQWATVSASIPAGSGQDRVLKVIETSIASFGISGCEKAPELMPTKYVRGKVLYGQTTEALDDLAKANRFMWGYGNDQLIAFKQVTTDERDVILLNSATGLIGRPQMTPGGLKVRALLDPRLQIGQIIKIDQSTVQHNGFTTATEQAVSDTNMAALGHFDSADGLYVVWAREFSGDVRGADWYADMICVSVNDQMPIASSITNFVPN